VSGLSQIVDDYLATGMGEVRVTYEVALPSFSIDTTYYADLILDVGLNHSIKGSGKLEASVEDVFFRFNATGLLPYPDTSKPLALNTLDVDLGFSNLKLNADNTTVDDNTIIDWEQAATRIETLFHTIWNDEVRGTVNEMVRCSIDHVVNVSLRVLYLRFAMTVNKFNLCLHI